ncbi:Uncharacterised protein [Enterobacter cloacae]|nr:Uncharacterised protein [Enterobacter cloacae]
MGKADGLPAGNHCGSARDNITEPENIAVRLVLQVRPVTAKGVIGKLADLIRLAAIVEVFKMTETQMAFRHADQHRPLLHRFPGHRRVAGDNGQRA